jgi:hypothetical protein
MRTTTTLLFGLGVAFFAGPHDNGVNVGKAFQLKPVMAFLGSEQDNSDISHSRSDTTPALLGSGRQPVESDPNEDIRILRARTNSESDLPKPQNKRIRGISDSRVSLASRSEVVASSSARRRVSSSGSSSPAVRGKPRGRKKLLTLRQRVGSSSSENVGDRDSPGDWTPGGKNKRRSSSDVEGLSGRPHVGKKKAKEQSAPTKQEKRDQRGRNRSCP